VIRETLISPRVDTREKYQIMEVQMIEESWMTPLKSYLADDQLPEDADEARRIKKSSSRYTLIDGNLFRYGFSRPLLICVDMKEASRIMTELHEAYVEVISVEEH